MKIFEVAGEGKLHGLTVMSLDKFVKKDKDVEESSKELPQWKKDWYAKQKPNSWPKHPQPYHNPNWIDELSPEEREKLIKGKGVTEGSGQKTFTVVYYSKKTDRNVTKNIKANNESQVWDQLKLKGIDVVSVKEQGITEDVSTDAKVYQNKTTGKFIAWVEKGKTLIKQEGNSKEEAVAALQKHLNDKISKALQSSNSKTKRLVLTSSFIKGMLGRQTKDPFYIKLDDSKLYVSEERDSGFFKVEWDVRVSGMWNFIRDVPSGVVSKANLASGIRYEIKKIPGEDNAFSLSYYSEILGSHDKQADIAPMLKIQETGRNLAQEGLNEFALPGGGDGDSGRWYTDDELADIIGDDWFEDFDVSHDEFNIDAYGEKAKKNLAGYANSWFDDKGYNVNVMGVDHNDVDHDLKWYIVGSFQNDNFADKDVEESNSPVIASTADRLSNKDDGRTAKLRAAGDARREQHLKGRDIAKNDRSSKDAWGDLKESFKSKADAIAYAKESVKTFRDKEDGIEIWAMPDGSFDVNHTMNSSGRNHSVNNGGKKVGTIRAGSLSEAPGEFGLGANYRAVPDEEMQALMGRSKNKQKTKRDKFDYPYIHGSNIEVKDEAGKTFNAEKLRAAIMTRPERILGQNAKFQHSETGTEAVFSIGLPALKGLAVNEKTGEFVVVDTCPGAGACQTYCYAMKGSYVMFKAVSMALARMLNFLLNDPAGFVSQLNSEIASARSKYAKKGAKIVIRWHEAGDFFSNEYLDVAYKVAEANPDVGFYAYTKMGDVANAARPKNFNMNFSQGAKSSQEKKVNITRTKHSKVVPKEMFFDLIARNGNELIKDAKGRMQFASPENLDKFKTIMAQKYAIDKDSILTYDQIMKTPIGDTPKWNVFVMPGDGDNSANRNDVIGTYLLFH